MSQDKVGDVLVAQGDLTAALEAYRTSLAIFERRAAHDAGNAGRQRDLSAIQEKLGDVPAEQGNVAAALEEYCASLAILERFAAQDAGHAGSVANFGGRILVG